MESMDSPSVSDETTGTTAPGIAMGADGAGAAATGRGSGGAAGFLPRIFQTRAGDGGGGVTISLGGGGSGVVGRAGRRRRRLSRAPGRTSLKRLLVRGRRAAGDELGEKSDTPTGLPATRGGGGGEKLWAGSID
mmetsp:Transcript_30145/g.93245  ORF Transcript_30145/g.93245 Transcript_30145/m.93245 type:complete len:134 (+) Transcript_30145:216-617(+)